MRFLPLLIGGQYSTLYWWELAAYLFGFSSIITVASWLLTTLRERPKPNGNQTWTLGGTDWINAFLRSFEPADSKMPSEGAQETAMPTMRRRGKTTVWIGTPLVLALGIAAGYAIRDHQLLTSTITYSDVDILQKISDKRFIMRPQWMKALDSELCPGPPVDWQAGDRLRDWTFEQRQGCKRVISYHKYPKGEVDAAIQMR